MSPRSPNRYFAFALLLVGICLAQFPPGPVRGSGSGKWIRIEGGAVIDEDAVRTARETASHSTGLPEWTNSPAFERDVFTFARVIFQNDPNASGGRGFGGPRLGWWVDYPDADL